MSDEIAAEFEINNVELEAEFELSNDDNIEADFEIYASGTVWGNIDGNIENQTDLVDALNSKQDVLTAGDNISIEDNVISATDTTYTAGTGISIENNVISNTQTSAEWGNIEGNLSDQTDLKDALDTLDGAIDSNHQEISNINHTIQNYGDIVSYDAADFATKNQGDLADTAIQPGDNITELVNNAGYITGIDSTDVTTALGYTPYNSTNPDGFISGIDSSDVTTALGYTPYDSSNPDGYITAASLPTVNDGKLALQVNSVDVGEFTANQATTSTVNISVPTDTSDLTNGAGYITASSLPTDYYTKAEIDNIIPEPTKEPIVYYQPTNSYCYDSSDNRFYGSHVSEKLYLVKPKTSGTEKVIDMSTTFSLAFTIDYKTAPSTAVTVAEIMTSYAAGKGLLLQLNSSGLYYKNNITGTTVSGTRTLTAGNSYDIKAEYDGTHMIVSYKLSSEVNYTQANSTTCTADGSNYNYAAIGMDTDYGDLSLSSVTLINGGTTLYSYTAGKIALDYDSTLTLNASNQLKVVADQTYDGTSTNPQSGVAIAGAKFVSNNATGTNAFAVGNTSQSTAEGGVAVGYGARANSTYSTAVGQETRATNTNTTVIGRGAKATQARAIAIGSGAEANAQDAIAIKGINNTANTLQVYNYNMLDMATGLIPDARISTNIARTTDMQTADNGLQSQIDAIVASSDVFDIVGTYADLQAYDISTVPVNDIIKVLVDSTHNDAATYYRCTESGGVKSWTYIGAEGAYYTKAESDNRFVAKTTTINGKALSSNITLDASDVNALPDSTVIPTVNDSTITIQKNGTDVETFTLNQSSNETVNLIVPTDTSDLTNGAGYITGITSGDVTTALGYTPYDDSNPDGFISGITSGDVTTALGYTPYDSSNPSGYTTNVGTVTSVNNTLPDGNGNVTIAGITVDQTYDGTSANAQSGVAIEGELTANYQEKLSSGTNIKTVNNTTILGSGNIDTSEIFLAVQGTTTFSQISTAYNSGKTILLKDENNDIGYLLRLISGAEAEFIVGSNTLVSVDDLNQWTFIDNYLNIPNAQVNSDWNAVSGVAQILNKPTIPTVNNATLTIQKNGVDVQTFTANASSNATANITVPTNTNELTNGAGFITGITSNDVTTALGYTPYNSSNPNGYTSNVGTVTSVNSVSPVNGNVSLSIPTVDQTFDGTSANAESGVSILGLLQTIYPVGSVYLSTNSTCPMASLFGTWELVASDKALWTGDGTNGGTTKAAGLPSITGLITSKDGNNNLYSPFTTYSTVSSNSALRLTAETSKIKSPSLASSTYNNMAYISFDASKSSTIYGNTSTVQPPAYVVNVWRRTA